MGWMAAAAAVSALAGLGSAAVNASRSNGQAEQKQALSNYGLTDAQSNAQYQRMLSTLINQRSVAGSSDSAGTTVKYDPATNQWVSELGALPQQVQTSADQAAVSRNTTDLKQAQAANAQAAIRAARGEGYADSSRRELENFRPTTGSEMTALLGEQATRASNATYTPLINDTLRSFARTGTSAGPVLAELGKSSASNLRDSLIDARLKGMTGADTSNQSRRADLASAAQSGASLATPGFGYSQISPSSYSSTMSNLLGQRANTAAVAPAYGASGVNSAEKDVQSAYGNSISNVANPNYSIDQTVGALNSVKSTFGKGGAVSDLNDAFSKLNKSTNTNSTGNYSFGGAGTLGDYQMYPASAI